MKPEGRTMWIIGAIVLIIVAAGFLSYHAGKKSSEAQRIADIQKQLDIQKQAIRAEYEKEITALETERDKYKADYDRLLKALAKKAAQKQAIKPPKDAAELKKRLSDLGYPPKEIR